MISYRIVDVLSKPNDYEKVIVKGWVKTFRANRFIALNDGSSIENLQCVVNYKLTDESLLKKINTGAALEIEGELIKSMGKGQSVEVLVKSIVVHGEADPDTYPIQAKKHSFEFLREKAHLRIRTKTFSSVMRIRSILSFAIHQFFNEKGFCYIHTPIITGSDAEGAGEMFRVTILDPKNPKLNDQGNVDFKNDFFGKETNLTVSGQLEAETYSQGLGNVYTFGPTFRAEKSKTRRHLTEFWMVEPEMAYVDLDENMTWAEQLVGFIIQRVLETCANELMLLERDTTKLESIVPPFPRITYDEAVSLLKDKGVEFIYGSDFGAPDETILSEQFDKPILIHRWPANIKAFYMKRDTDNPDLALGVDMIAPEGYGEIIGGGQREDDLDVLVDTIRHHDLPMEPFKWYLDLRKFGSVPHSGFGLGLERTVAWICGTKHIRETIPFPRTMSRLEP